MRRGCISLGEIQCDGCNRVIPYPERYLIIEEEDGIEAEEVKSARYCIACCLKRGYARYREDKGGQVLTFFPEPEY